MAGLEWSRSRYWLCHFLHNRHERGRIVWDRPLPADAPLRPLLLRWLRDVRHRAAHRGDRIIALALRRCPADPAFVQSLRLLVKEEKAVADLTQKFLGLPVGPASSSRLAHHSHTLLAQTLGLRFECSLILLDHLLDITLARLVAQATPPSTLADLLRQILHDRQAHVGFISEWLTMEFADFNFLRRNLRRLRLRLIFALFLGRVLLKHSALIHALGCSRLQFALACWNNFRLVLEQIVPYHRDALLAALLTQREHPFDKPAQHI